MKAIKERELAIESTLDGKKHRFGFHEDSVEALMDVLTDQYSDIPLAILRELSVNARDSHVEAGNPDPIEVELPTSMSEQLIIRDRGTGLSPEDAIVVYTMYGYSTKREDDRYAGMLGIGSKSPLAYCDAFDVVARKDGLQTTLIVSRNEKDVGELEEIVTRTDQPDGVEIRIPVKQADVHRFHDKADWFFSFWKSPVLVKVNGEWLRWDNRAIGGYVKVNDEFAVSEPRLTGYYQTHYDSYIVMGDIPYEVPDEHATLKTLKFGPYSSIPMREFSVYRESDNWGTSGYVCWVPIGTIEFAPNREKVKNSDHSVEALKSLTEYWKEYGPRILHEYAQDLEFDKIIDAYDDRGLLGFTRPYWHGVHVPRPLDIYNSYKHKKRVSFRKLKDSDSSIDDVVDRDFKKHSYIHNSQVSALSSDENKKVLVRGFKPRSFSSGHSYRILKAAELSGLDLFEDTPGTVVGVQVWTNGPARSLFYEWDLVIDWEEVKSMTSQLHRIQRRKRPEERLENIVLHTRKNGLAKRFDILEGFDKYRPLVYWFPSDKLKYRTESFLYDLMPDLQLAEVYKKQFKYFERVYPQAVHYSHAIELHMAMVLEDLKDEDLFVIEGGLELFDSPRAWRHAEFGLEKYDWTRLDDVELVDMFTRIDFGRSGPRRFKTMAMHSGKSGTAALKKLRPDAYEKAKNLVERIKKEYPLAYESTRSTQEFTDYMNAMHAYHRRT